MPREHCGTAKHSSLVVPDATTLRRCGAARILSYQPQSHLPYLQTHTPPIPKSSAVTTHSPGTALGPPLLQTSQSQPRAQPSRLSLVATCCEVGFSSQGQGSGIRLLQQCTVPAGDSRGLCASSTGTVFAGLPQMETGCTFLTTSLSAFPSAPKSTHLPLQKEGPGSVLQGALKGTPGLWCTKGLPLN